MREVNDKTHVVGKGITTSDIPFIIIQASVNTTGSSAGYSSGGGHKYQFSIYDFGLAVLRDAVEVVYGRFSF
jgi:hypothetical protein